MPVNTRDGLFYYFSNVKKPYGVSSHPHQCECELSSPIQLSPEPASSSASSVNSQLVAVFIACLALCSTSESRTREVSLMSEERLIELSVCGCFLKQLLMNLWQMP